MALQCHQRLLTSQLLIPLNCNASKASSPVEMTASGQKERSASLRMNGPCCSKGTFAKARVSVPQGADSSRWWLRREGLRRTRQAQLMELAAIYPSEPQYPT